VSELVRPICNCELQSLIVIDQAIQPVLICNRVKADGFHNFYSNCRDMGLKIECLVIFRHIKRYGFFCLPDISTVPYGSKFLMKPLKINVAGH